MATTTAQDLPKLKPQYLSTAYQLPQQGFVRICQIVGSKSKGIPAILPIGRTSFLNGVKSGKYPKPVRLGERTVAWKVEDIRALIVSLGA
jgi:prophage regulatory protein